ncbi:hypothetical protein [Paramagnetospirillum magneticum]|uniref:Uncharacterized protein n=1 Tax=Paramagnetospirillum magneticum (strain ATCC 700264 / AMB-1) TaxID=342108 RepID=Q2W9I5_PARM1|nr:hypothetical protein [Paramagnetospirillum magneticum]BAE49490.1 hypothetical protein amb0686 [Paramagnetospirillum magneticum AMB-1]
MTESRIDEIKELVDLLQNGTALELMEVCQRKIAEGSLNPYYFMVMGVISCSTAMPALACSWPSGRTPSTPIAAKSWMSWPRSIPVSGA